MNLSAGVDIAEVIDFARPPFVAELITHLGPPHRFGLFDHGQRTFVGALLLARAVALTRNVLLVNNAGDPNLPVAAPDITQQIDWLTCSNLDVRRANGDRT